MAHAQINGVKLFYADEGVGEPVILHHGYTNSHEAFEGAVARLAPRFRCIVMDCRGAGDSARPDAGHTIEQYAADVVGMADHLGIDRFAYVGHSMGGVIGMELGIHHASRLRRLVLVAPAPADGVQMPPGVRERGLALRESQDRPTLLRERKAMSARFRPEEAHARMMERALSVSDAHYEQSWEALVNSARGDRLSEIKVPTLMIAGAADGLLSSNLEDFRRLPNATLHVFSRVSHGIPYEVPEAFAEVVADFLEYGVVTAATLQAAMLASAPAR